MSNSRVFRGIRTGAAIGALALTVQAGKAQNSTVPDAQVESNVLRQLATAPELSTQNIQSTTVYGTVTLSGVVQTEALRTRAENLAARADGVKKVVDQLTLGDPSPASSSSSDSNTGAPAEQQAYTQGGQLQSDGTFAPQSPDPAQGNTAPAQTQNNQAYGNQPQYDPNDNNQQTQPPAYNQQSGSTNQQQAYNQPYPQQPGYQPYPPARRPMYGNGYGAPYGDGSSNAPGAGQQAGVPVTVPGGALLQVRINRGIDSNHIQPGAPFQGIVLNDVVANGAVAIPRGATVQGTVADAHKAGVLGGRGELALQLNSLTLGGQNYPIVSVPWDREGRDKTITTVNSALGLGALGAILGGVAGGGSGAAIGAAAGGAVGVAGSAASGSGRVIVPPESVLTFHLAQPTTVTTVSQQEMARLSYAAGPYPGGPVPVRRRYYSPYGYYYGPGPVPAPYRPY